MSWQEVSDALFTWFGESGIRLLFAVIVLIVSFALINWVAKKLGVRAERRIGEGKVDKTLYKSLSYIFRIVAKVVIIAALIGYLGFDTSGFAALLASLGVGLGLAVNGTLSNFAGGVLLLITRPFADDDFIEACGYSGTVEDILICNTKIRTPDHKVVYLPNGKLSTTEIVNYSAKATRRIDLTFSVAYEDDFEKAKTVILEVCSENPKVLQDPAPTARVGEHADSSIRIFTRAWCRTEDYWDVRFDLLEGVKRAFDRERLHIPFPQLDVHNKAR